MADFDPPFAHSTTDRRPPTTDEIDNGFPCGPLDRPLWNWLFWMLQAEVGEVIDFAGLTGDNGDTTQLRQAIEAMIAAATGGGDTSQFLLVSQARARLPIFPDVTTGSTGLFGITSTGAGNVRVPAGVNFQHRGIYPLTSVLTDIATNVSKTYHLRCDLTTNTWALKDLADIAYNPTALAENDASFDSTYDSMLAARVVTNAGNAVTITNLANKARLRAPILSTVTPVHNVNHNWTASHAQTFNWARTPAFVAAKADVYATDPGSPSAFVQGGANHTVSESWDRYGWAMSMFTDWNANPAGFTIVSSTARGGASD